jgi:hypothetical protein
MARAYTTEILTELGYHVLLAYPSVPVLICR